jgi:hypothetical protein
LRFQAPPGLAQRLYAFDFVFCGLIFCKGGCPF